MSRYHAEEEFVGNCLLNRIWLTRTVILATWNFMFRLIFRQTNRPFVPFYKGSNQQHSSPQNSKERSVKQTIASPTHRRTQLGNRAVPFTCFPSVRYPRDHGLAVITGRGNFRQSVRSCVHDCRELVLSRPEGWAGGGKGKPVGN